MKQVDLTKREPMTMLDVALGIVAIIFCGMVLYEIL